MTTDDKYIRIKNWFGKNGIQPDEVKEITKKVLGKEKKIELLHRDEEINSIYNLIVDKDRDDVFEIIRNGTQPVNNLPSPGGEGQGEGGGLELVHNDDIVNTQVTDEDGEVVTITQEMRDEFLLDHGMLQGAFWQMAFSLSRIKKNKSYLAGRFTSFNDYAKNAIPLGVRQAYGYALVGEKFKNYEDKLSDGRTLNVGITKAKFLASQSQEEVNRLMEKGEITIGDEMLTQEELENETITSLRARLKLAEEDKKKAEEKSQKAELLEEKLKNANMEKEDLEAFRKQHLDRVDREAEMKDMIDDAWHYVTEARKKLAALDLSAVYTGEDASPEAHEVVDLFYRLTTFMEESAFFVRNKNEFVIEEYLFLQENDTENRKQIQDAFEKVVENKNEEN